jgi:hypothetical protein
MKSIAANSAERLGRFIANDFREIFGSSHSEAAERLASLARVTIECIGRSDALYHNFEHTFLVTLVARDILRGRMLTERIEIAEYGHLIMACLLHDIGYVRGVLKGDTSTEFVVDGNGKKVTLPRGASDISLADYHVDRSKLFVFERLGNSPMTDPSRLAKAIEHTRFPPREETKNSDLEPRLVQAADLIGQLGDPLYPRKANALYYEFEEIGRNQALGYSSPADLIDKYPVFFWNQVSEHIVDGTKYLNLTASGRQWVANLHNHVFCAEHDKPLMGPQG